MHPYCLNTANEIADKSQSVRDAAELLSIAKFADKIENDEHDSVARRLADLFTGIDKRSQSGVSSTTAHDFLKMLEPILSDAVKRGNEELRELVNRPLTIAEVKASTSAADPTAYTSRQMIRLAVNSVIAMNPENVPGNLVQQFEEVAVKIEQTGTADLDAAGRKEALNEVTMLTNRLGQDISERAAGGLLDQVTRKRLHEQLATLQADAKAMLDPSKRRATEFDPPKASDKLPKPLAKPAPKPAKAAPKAARKTR